MILKVGAVLEGRVSGIAKFGAFVTLPDGKSGLVHISELADTYVNDVRDYVTVGQAVKVRVLNISGDGKINLSIKRAESGRAPGEGRDDGGKRDYSGRKSSPAGRAPENHSFGGREQSPAGPSGDRDFEDKLKKFMQESDSRIAENKIYAEYRQRNRRR
ncbi:MAG: S1 RNA-binding domain-containing protein [Candidatus Limivicinus sp.]|jgi:S1 RNA binding domain protein